MTAALEHIQGLPWDRANKIFSDSTFHVPHALQQLEKECGPKFVDAVRSVCDGTLDPDTAARKFPSSKEPNAQYPWALFLLLAPRIPKDHGKAPPAALAAQANTDKLVNIRVWKTKQGLTQMQMHTLKILAVELSMPTLSVSLAKLQSADAEVTPLNDIVLLFVHKRVASLQIEQLAFKPGNEKIKLFKMNGELRLFVQLTVGFSNEKIATDCDATQSGFFKSTAKNQAWYLFPKDKCLLKSCNPSTQKFDVPEHVEDYVAFPVKMCAQQGCTTTSKPLFECGNDPFKCAAHASRKRTFTVAQLDGNTLILD